MNKFNKKGFTLIEMLVVIAIIAVLVSIIIPTVSSATDKAAAATNAANLRSLVAEATTKYLTNDQSQTGNVQVTITRSADGDTIEVDMLDNAPKSKKCNGISGGEEAELVWDEDKAAFIASYEGFTLDQYQMVASGECSKLSETTKTE